LNIGFAGAAYRPLAVRCQVRADFVEKLARSAAGGNI
jgi:hypothetical protein